MCWDCPPSLLSRHWPSRTERTADRLPWPPTDGIQWSAEWTQGTWKSPRLDVNLGIYPHTVTESAASEHNSSVCVYILWQHAFPSNFRKFRIPGQKTSSVLCSFKPSPAPRNMWCSTCNVLQSTITSKSSLHTELMWNGSQGNSQHYSVFISTIASVCSSKCCRPLVVPLYQFI